jgi:hypothetical protein
MNTACELRLLKQFPVMNHPSILIMRTTTGTTASTGTTTATMETTATTTAIMETKGL